MLQMKMKMTVVGLHGVLLVTVVGPRKVFAKEHGRDNVIHPCHLREAYPVMDPIQRQSIAT